MLMSGNGRHRKPRQAPTTVVMVAATGAGIALPLFASSGAQAADTATWNAVAHCESGGLWSANTGNGFYGGLQITQETWDLYDGQKYADRPDLASQNEQIAVAEVILDDVGTNAWPSCAARAGLVDEVTGKDDSASHQTSDGASNDATDEASASASASDGATDTLTDAASGPASAPASPSAAGGADDGAATASPSPSSTGSASPSAPTTGGGRHAKPEGTATATQQAQARAVWGELTRSTTKAADTTGTADTAGTSTDTAQRYRVRGGDSLCDIAAEQHVDGGWRALYEANKGVIGDNPNLIHPGQYLTVG